MFTDRTMKHARQDKADLEADLAKLRVEINQLVDVPEAKQTAADRARHSALAAEYGALSQRAATVAAELAHFERLQAEEIERSNITPATAPHARGRRFAEMFSAMPLHAGGFANSNEFLATVHSGLADPRLTQAYDAPRLGAIGTVGTPSDGGFSVPTQFFQQWLDSSLENEIVRSRADVRPMISDTAVAPGWDDGDHSSTLYGGFSGEWLQEASAMTEQTGKLRLIELKARKLGILARVSNELIADGVSFDAQLGQAIIKALGWFLDRAFLAGNGAAAPLGILNSGAVIAVPKETNQAAATINYSNISKMFARLQPSSYSSAIWICNSTAIPQLLQLSLPIGTAGSAVPVMSESDGKFRMLTLPVVFTEKVPALGTVGDVILADLSQYVVGVRADFTLAKSSHAGFASDTSYYRGIIRVDGQPKRATPITPDSGDTLSPFVTLAARA